jgi:hypothetical protein
MILRILLSLYLAFGFLGDALALSCRGYTHDYIVHCDGRHCRTPFSADQVAAFAACSRRPVVSSVDGYVDAFVSDIVLVVHGPKPRGLYQLTLTRPYWNDKNDTQHARLMAELEHSLPRDERGAACKPEGMSAAQVVALLNKPGSKAKVVQLTADGSERAIQAKREEFESAARMERIKNILLELGYWGSAVLVLLAFIHSVHLYFSRLYGARPRTGRVPLLGPVAIQLAIGVAGVAATFISPVGFWPGSLLVPAAVAVLMCEGWARLAVARTRKEN